MSISLCCAVIDTNIVIAGLLTSDPQAPTALILDAMLKGTFPFALSQALVTEYRQVLLRPAIARRHKLNEKEVDTLLETLALNGIFLSPTPSQLKAPDTGDQHLWDLLLVAPNSAVLVSGDKLIVDQPPQGIPAYTPQEFWKLRA